MRLQEDLTKLHKCFADLKFAIIKAFPFLSKLKNKKEKPT